MTKRKYYTNEEDLVIISEVKKSPENLTTACKKAAEKLEGRTWKSCYNRWQSKLKHQEKCFVTISSRKAYYNNKHKAEDCISTTSKIWQKILKIIFNTK